MLSKTLTWIYYSLSQSFIRRLIGTFNNQIYLNYLIARTKSISTSKKNGPYKKHFVKYFSQT